MYTLKKAFHSCERKVAFFMGSASLFLFATMVPVQAQIFDKLTNPEVNVTIEHPPALDLKVEKVAFNADGGNCSEPIIESLIADFVSNGVEVVDRDNLKAILAEHKFSLSRHVNQAEAIEIGKIMGPSALLTVNVLRCETKSTQEREKVQLYNSKTERYYTGYQYIAKTITYLKVSIQIADLTTGRIFSARVLESAPGLQRKSTDGRPTPPSKYEVEKIAFDWLTFEVHKMFFSWEENAELYFFNDKKGDLKHAYNALASGNIEYAFKLAQESAEECERSADYKNKTKSHALYNLGMMHFIKNNYDEALICFQKAQQYRSGNIIDNAIRKTIRAKKYAEEIQRMEASSEMVVQMKRAEQEAERKSRASKMLTNEDIIALAGSGLSNSLIANKIKTSPCNFDTSPDGLIALSKGGVPEEIIMLMMEKE